jgi:hypothetical protein
MQQGHKPEKEEVGKPPRQRVLDLPGRKKIADSQIIRNQVCRLCNAVSVVYKLDTAQSDETHDELTQGKTEESEEPYS